MLTLSYSKLPNFFMFFNINHHIEQSIQYQLKNIILLDFEDLYSGFSQLQAIDSFYHSAYS